jgi:hypothetical protein
MNFLRDCPEEDVLSICLFCKSNDTMRPEEEITIK